MATGGLTITLEARVRRLWLVQAAARTRSLRVVRLALRLVRVETRIEGGRWQRMPVHLDLVAS